LNHSYAECDVFISIAKLKGARDRRLYRRHEELLWNGAGVTIYGSDAGRR